MVEKYDDSVHISAMVENPNSHQVTAKAYVNDLNNLLTDSTVLIKNGNSWTGGIVKPQTEDYYKVSVAVLDNSSQETFTLRNATRFATSGPVTLDSIMCVEESSWFAFRPFVKNHGTTLAITNAKVKILCNDPWVSSINYNTINLPDIVPGASTGASSWAAVSVIDSLFPGNFNFKVEIMHNNWPYWTASVNVIVSVEDKKYLQPFTYSLEQNYPNPFNPVTVVSCQLPVVSMVSIKIYDLLGREIETLVNEEKPAGTYEIKWDAENLPSGVYFYQLKAGDFIQTKKMILMK